MSVPSVPFVLPGHMSHGTVHRRVPWDSTIVGRLGHLGQTGHVGQILPRCTRPELTEL
jgi:hypothetical protein